MLNFVVSLYASAHLGLTNETLNFEHLYAL